jgi:hypothetical protein
LGTIQPGLGTVGKSSGCGYSSGSLRHGSSGSADTSSFGSIDSGSNIKLVNGVDSLSSNKHGLLRVSV